MDDILKTLGSKSATSGAEKSATSQDRQSSLELAANGSRGQNLLDHAGKKEETSSQISHDTQTTTSSKEEPSVSSQTDLSTWTVESAVKEAKKAREEAKLTRIKYEESLEKLKLDAETRIKSREKELEKSLKAAEELEEMKSKEADKKRDLAERLAHRESALSQIKAEKDIAERAWQEKLASMESKVSRYEAEAEAQMQVYKVRLEEEFKTIPEKYRDVATLIVKGAGDSRDAVIALNEAKLKGLFEDKTVIINHSVPGAADGARATNERLQEASKAARDKMNSSQKIKTALTDIRQGSPNTAFRIK